MCASTATTLTPANIRLISEQREINRETVTTSAILAKAVVKRNGRTTIICVFEQSTRHEFYWVFEAKTGRSPRRSWKHFHEFYRRGDPPFQHQDFGAFVEWYCKIKHAEIVTVRVPKARRLAVLLAAENLLHETVGADWRPQDLSRATFTLLDQRFQKRVKGRTLDYWPDRRPK